MTTPSTTSFHERETRLHADALAYESLVLALHLTRHRAPTPQELTGAHVPVYGADTLRSLLTTAPDLAVVVLGDPDGPSFVVTHWGDDWHAAGVARIFDLDSLLDFVTPTQDSLSVLRVLHWPAATS